MAIKLNAPLFSFGITKGGSIGPLTYTRNNRVYPRVNPANPRTEEQGNIRQIMAAAQKAISLMGPNARAAAASLAPVGYRWNSYVFGLLCGTDFKYYNAIREKWADLTAQQQETWNTLSQAAGFETTEIDYASDEPISSGAICFALGHVLAERINYGPTPEPENAAAVIASITA